MKGRKPHPVERRAHEGNPGHNKRPEPVLVGGRPELEELREPPADLPPDAKEFWTYAVGRLTEVGILDRVDLPVLELLAVQYARARQAQRAVDTQGMFTKGYNGQVVIHPAVRIERDATAQFMKMAEHYALTPIARTRLGIAELHRRSMVDEMDETLGKPQLEPAT